MRAELQRMRRQQAIEEPSMLALARRTMTSYTEGKRDVQAPACFGAADNHSDRPPQQHQHQQVCTQCGATKTPQWREGPLGPRTLCNACGVKRHRQLKAALNRQAGGTEDEASVSKYKRPLHAQAGQTKPLARALPGVDCCSSKQEDDLAVGVKRAPDSLDQSSAQRLVELACARVLANGKRPPDHIDAAGTKRLKPDLEQAPAGSQAHAAQFAPVPQARPDPQNRDELSRSPRPQPSGGATVHDGVERRGWRSGWASFDALTAVAASASLPGLCPPSIMQPNGPATLAQVGPPLTHMNGRHQGQTSAESAATTLIGQLPERSEHGQYGRGDEVRADPRDIAQLMGSVHGRDLAMSIGALQRPPVSSPLSGPSSCAGGHGLDRSKRSQFDTVLARCSSVLDSFPDAESVGLRNILATYYDAVNNTAHHTRLLEQCLQQLTVVGAQHEQARSRQAAVEKQLIEIDALISRLLEGHVSMGNPAL